jgi:replicative DNA helicase
MERLHSGKSIKSGIKPIDDFLYHFTAGNYVLKAARPSVGKTALALSMALNMLQRDKKVLFISLEMSVSEIIMRLASMHSGIPIWKFKYHNDTYTDPQLYDFNKLIERKNLIVLNELSEENLRLKIKIMKEKYALDAVFVDYIGLISSKDHKHGENQTLTRISRNLKVSAIENSLPFFILCQLNRDSEKRQDNKPVLSDIRSSGSIEQDADIIMFPYRYKEVDVDGYKILGSTVEIIVAKQRSGKTGTIGKIEFVKDIAKFQSNDNSVPTEAQITETKKQPQQIAMTDAQYDANGNLIF